MNLNSKLALTRRKVPVRMPANSFQKNKVTLNDVLTFISHAKIVPLRVVKLALLARRDYLEYTVIFKSGHREDWTVDSADHMIDILIKERREISHVKPGKEYMNV